MNGKIRKEIVKLIEAKKACEESTKRMKKMTAHAKEYIEDTISIFNENNGTTEILQGFKDTETILDKYAILKKFHNNSYILFYIYKNFNENGTWDFENEVELYSNTKLYNETKKMKILEVNQICNFDCYKSTSKSTLISVGFNFNKVLSISNDFENSQSFVANITDEKMILEILNIATKMIEMYADAQNEFTEILVKLKENHYREILNAVWE